MFCRVSPDGKFIASQHGRDGGNGVSGPISVTNVETGEQVGVQFVQVDGQATSLSVEVRFSLEDLSESRPISDTGSTVLTCGLVASINLLAALSKSGHVSSDGSKTGCFDRDQEGRPFRVDYRALHIRQRASIRICT